MFEQQINENMISVNVTRSQMEVLVYTYIKNKNGIEVNQVDLEKDLNLKNPTVTGLISRLEKKGYIIQRPIDADTDVDDENVVEEVE